MHVARSTPTMILKKKYLRSGICLDRNMPTTSLGCKCEYVCMLFDVFSLTARKTRWLKKLYANIAPESANIHNPQNQRESKKKPKQRITHQQYRNTRLREGGKGGRRERGKIKDIIPGGGGEKRLDR